MSRFNAFKKSVKKENKQNRFKKNDRHERKSDNGGGMGGERKKSRWDNLNTNDNSFTKHSNNFSKRNNFKRRRNKRFYKSQISKEDFDKKMAMRGSRQMGISLDDMIKKKPEKIKKVEVKSKTEKTNVKIQPEKAIENEKMTDEMKYLILNQYYENDSDEEAEETLETTEKDDDIIGFN